MRTPIVVALMWVGLAPYPALALDWSLRSTLSESVEVNDNQFMRKTPAGSVGSYSTVTANAEARTPTSKFDVDADVNFRKYWGPGTDGISMTESRSDSFKARYEALGKNEGDKSYVEASWGEQSTAFALLNEFGRTTNATGFLDTASFSGGFERQLTVVDFVTLSARGSLISYDPPAGGTSYSDATASATWRHRVSPTLALTANSEVEWLQYDNAQNTSVVIQRDTAGIDIALTQLLSFRGTAGVGVVTTERGSSGLGGSGSGVTSSASGTVADYIADLLLTYRILKNTTLTLSGSRTVAPSVVGSLFKRDSVRAGLIHAFNSRTTLSLAADATRSTGAGSTSDYLSGSASLSYLLARDWNAQLSYRHLHVIPRTTDVGVGSIDPITGIPTLAFLTPSPVGSNSVTVVVSHAFTVLPRGQ